MKLVRNVKSVLSIYPYFKTPLKHRRQQVFQPRFHSTVRKFLAISSNAQNIHLE